MQRTKNHYECRMPLTKHLQAALKTDVILRRINDQTVVFFITALDVPSNAWSILYQIRKQRKDVDLLLEGQCSSPHVFQRTSAKNKIRAGVDVCRLQA